MTDQDRDQRARSTRLCIVSRDRLLCGEFVESLQESLDPDDEIEIVLDRRQRRPATEAKPDATHQSFKDRRRHPHVDRALRLHGFAIVPVSVTDPLKMGRPRAPHVPDPAIERLSPEDMDERDRLEDILDFGRRRRARLRPWLILGGLSGATLVLLLLFLLPATQTRLSRFRLATPPVAEQTKEPPLVAPALPAAQAPPVAETPAPNREASVVPPAAGPERQEPERPREASTPPKAEPERPRDAVRPLEARTSSRPEAERRRETRTPPRPAPGPIVSAPPAASVPPSGPSDSKVTPRFVGLPQVELTRNPSREGRGEAYAVRISDPAGRPIEGAEVVLVGRLADGTALDIPLESGPEPGTYRGTALSGATAPVDLRIRVVTSDKRVEIPVRP